MMNIAAKAMTKKLCLLAVILSTVGCSSKQANEMTDELVYGVVVSSDPESQLNRMNLLVDYISRELDMPVKYIKGTDYAAVIEAMKSGKVHIAQTGPFSYLIASAKANAEPLVASAYEKDSALNYYGSTIFTSADSDIKSMEDVKERVGELSLAFSDPASTSGYLFPLSYLRSIGIEPEEDFKEVLFAGGHAAGVFSTISGKVDIACTGATSLDRLAEKGRIPHGSYRKLWISRQIPPGPIYVRNDLPESIKQKLIDAYTHLPERAPEVLEVIRTMHRKEIIYVPVTDSVYTNLRNLVNQELSGLLGSES